MKKEDRKYFSKKLNEMADNFNQAVLCKRPDIKSAVGPAFEVQSRLIEKANKFSKDLYDEFKAAGYNDKDWKALTETSGAQKKLDKLVRQY